MNHKVKIAIAVSHPIQHFCPQYVSFAQSENVDLMVFFGSALGHKKYLDQNFKKEISWSNLNLDKFPHVFLNDDAVLIPDKNLDAASLEKELEDFNPEIIITYGYFQKLQRRAKNWAQKNHKILAYISDSELRHKENKPKRLFKYFFLKRYFSKIDIFLSVGNANEEYYKHFGVKQNRIFSMHFPIDLHLYIESFRQRDQLRKKVREKYGIAEDQTVLSVVGKLVPWKNQDHLIEAIKLLEDKEIYVSLFIIGSGEQSAEWQQKAMQVKKSKIYFTGFVNIEDLPGYYAASDLYVHPAFVEPHSIAVSEAIYMGCPVIMSDTCGSYGDDDDVQEGKNGYVYKFGDIEKLAEKIKLLITDEGLRKKFSAHSHKISTIYQTRSHLTILKELVEKAKKK